MKVKTLNHDKLARMLPLEVNARRRSRGAEKAVQARERLTIEIHWLELQRDSDAAHFIRQCLG